MRRALVALALALAAAVPVVGCGQENNSGLIPQDRSQRLVAAVDAIEAACQSGDAVQARAAADEATALVNELPRDVDRSLKRNMSRWLDRIRSRAIDDCEPEAAEEEPTAEPTATATAEPTETATPEPTETATPEPTETATPEPTETAPPAETPPGGEGGATAPEDGDGGE